MNNFHRFQNFRQFSNLFSQIWLKKRHTSLFSGICREIQQKFIKNSRKNVKFDEESERNGNSIFIREKCWRFLTKKLRLENGAKECIPMHSCNLHFFWELFMKFCIFSANFLWNFVRSSRQIPEKSDVCRFFNQICENKLESCRNFWNLWELFSIIQNYSLVSLAVMP